MLAPPPGVRYTMGATLNGMTAGDFVFLTSPHILVGPKGPASTRESLLQPLGVATNGGACWPFCV